MQEIKTDILVVGGGAGGTAAAIQAARRGAQTILVSEFAWLGGMLTSAGVAAPDGNELLAWQTGLWGAYLRELRQCQPGGLDQGWVSFFTYDPRVGAKIFADWVADLPNLKWIVGQVPLEVLKQGDRILGVRFADYTIHAHITLDGTELGDLLALGDIPHRWGWELQAEFGEPSAPIAPNPLTETYPVQAPTWVVILQDFGETAIAPEIPAPPTYNPALFAGAWDNYGGAHFLDYGRLPGDRFMINWPIHGNDYGEGVHRLVSNATDRHAFFQEALAHTQSFAHHIQTHLGRRYGLAEGVFPKQPLGGGAYALHPYYRESRRVQGLVTVREQTILPIAKGRVAPLPVQVWAQGCDHVENVCTPIAIGNYANDHHYPSGDIALQPKSLRWGGRWTGTPFTIPYGALVPKTTDGLLACEKNISVTHIANGATRLQPLVLGIGQAAGMAAALCVEQNIQPRDLAVRSLQEALLTDPLAPQAVIPLFNREPRHADWLAQQRYYLTDPERYPGTGYAIDFPSNSPVDLAPRSLEDCDRFIGTFHKKADQEYYLTIQQPPLLAGQDLAGQDSAGQIYKLVTLDASIDETLKTIESGEIVSAIGKLNHAGNWLLVEELSDG
jgi:FAD dependent oxidoreductase